MDIKYSQIQKLKNTHTRTPNPLKGAIVLSLIEVLKSPLGDLGVLTEFRGKQDLK
jgi:hypothetical protein